MAKKGVIYGTQTGIMRRIIVPDNDATLQSHVLPGESLLVIDTAAVKPAEIAGQANAALTALLGKVPPSGRAAVVKNGVVVNVLIIDHVLETIPGATLVPSETADIGDQYNGTAFLARFATVNKTTGVVSAVAFVDRSSPPAPNAVSNVVLTRTAQVGDKILPSAAEISART